MPIRNVCLGILILAFGGIINVQEGMLDKAVTVMEETELKIERGTCLVYWKPLYCLFPGMDTTLNSKFAIMSSENFTSSLQMCLCSCIG